MPLDISGDIAGLGKIVQIVRATDTTQRTTTSGTLVDVPGMSVTITPQKSDSAVLVVAHFEASITEGGLAYAYFTITDSNNNPISGAEPSTEGNATSSPSVQSQNQTTIIGYATPATTSAVTYKLRFRREITASTATVRVSNQNKTGQMFAIEVAA